MAARDPRDQPAAAAFPFPQTGPKPQGGLAPLRGATFGGDAPPAHPARAMPSKGRALRKPLFHKPVQAMQRTRRLAQITGRKGQVLVIGDPAQARQKRPKIGLFSRIRAARQHRFGQSQIILQGQRIAKSPALRARISQKGKSIGQMAQHCCLKSGKPCHWLFQEPLRPGSKGRLAPRRITAGAQNDRMSARQHQIADQKVPAPVGQPQINDHHIGPIGAQMRLGLCHRLSPP